MLRLFTLFFVFSIAAAHKVSYDGHQVWRIIPENEKGLIALVNLEKTNYELDFWQGPTRIGRNVDVRVSPDMAPWLAATLKSSNVAHKVLIQDLQRKVDTERSRSAKTARATSLDDFDYTEYHPAEEIYEWMNWIEAKYNFITKVQVATTYEGRPVYALEVFKPKTGDVKPKIYYDSLIHCREWVTAATALWTMNEMLTNPKWQHLVDDFDWYFIPMFNIDGYVETWTGDRFWRKTRSTGASSVCSGTDANRNFDEAHWSFPGASPNPCSQTYYGPTAASESEVRHVSNYIVSKHIDALLSVHSYTQLILYPYGWTDDLPPDNDALNETSKHQSEAIFAVHQKNYIYGPIAGTIYPASATTVDFGYNVAKIKYSFTYELRDLGEFGFDLPADQIVPNGEEFIAGLNALCQDVKNSM